MTGLAHHRLAQAVGYANGVLDAVTPQLLSKPTPCHAWDLRMLLEHADESLTALQEGFVDGRVAMSPAGVATAMMAGPDPASAGLAGAFCAGAAALLYASAHAGCGSPVAIGEHAIPLDYLRAVAALEIAVHAWDISQACGQCLPIPDEPAAGLLAQAPLLVPPLGRAPLFAAPVPVLPRATSSDRLTAYLGRSADQAVKESAAHPSTINL